MKHIKIIAFVFLIMLFNNYTYAISENFNKIIKNIEVKKYNNQGYEINEEIYYKYKRIVYGKPEDIENQVWVENENGRWIKDEKIGEYKFLGFNSVGELAVNYYFKNNDENNENPVNWNYIEDSNNYKSIIKDKYRFDKVKDYLLNQKLIYNGKKYNITANQIGLNKINVLSFPTWQNGGVVKVERLDNNNQIKEEILYTEPMCQNVKVTTKIENKNDSFAVGILDDYIIVPIYYSINLENINEYVTKKQIKKIDVNIYLNDILVDTFSKTPEFEIKDASYIKIYRTDFESNKFYQRFKDKTHLLANIKIRVKLYTQFATDIPLCGKDEIDIPITINPRLVTWEYIPPETRKIYITLNDEEYDIPIYEFPIYNNEEDNINENKGEDKKDDDKGSDTSQEYIDSINLSIIKYNDEEKTYNNLNKTISTNSASSAGFISAGQNLGVSVKTKEEVENIKIKILGDNSIKKFDNKTKKFEWDESIKKNISTKFNTIEEYYEYYNQQSYDLKKDKNQYYFEYLIPYETNQTLHSWNTIREITGSSNIDKTLITSRISDPYVILVEVYIRNKENNQLKLVQEKEVKFDVFECWKNLYNRDISPYIIN